MSARDSLNRYSSICQVARPRIVLRLDCNHRHRLDALSKNKLADGTLVKRNRFRILPHVDVDTEFVACAVEVLCTSEGGTHVRRVKSERDTFNVNHAYSVDAVLKEQTGSTGKPNFPVL